MRTPTLADLRTTLTYFAMFLMAFVIVVYGLAPHGSRIDAWIIANPGKTAIIAMTTIICAVIANAAVAIHNLSEPHVRMRPFDSPRVNPVDRDNHRLLEQQQEASQRKAG